MRVSGRAGLKHRAPHAATVFRVQLQVPRLTYGPLTSQMGNGGPGGVGDVGAPSRFQASLCLLLGHPHFFPPLMGPPSGCFLTCEVRLLRATPKSRRGEGVGQGGQCRPGRWSFWPVPPPPWYRSCVWAAEGTGQTARAGCARACLCRRAPLPSPCWVQALPAQASQGREEPFARRGLIVPDFHVRKLRQPWGGLRSGDVGEPHAPHRAGPGPPAGEVMRRSMEGQRRDRWPECPCPICVQLWPVLFPLVLLCPTEEASGDTSGMVTVSQGVCRVTPDPGHVLILP